MNLYEKVCRYIEAQEMLREGDLVLAGVSGGADSMAMLDLLERYRSRIPFYLEAVHVNHGIRGEEALRDQSYVENYCAGRGIPCRVCLADVPQYAAAHGMGLEEAGRILRAKALDQAGADVIQRLRKAGGQPGLLSPGGQEETEGPVEPRVRIALAHNQNDQAETVLHHLARGSGLKGLAGIRPVRENRIRPILCLQRQEIETYLQEQGISFVTDSTNLETDYTRNRIRLHVLPLLEREINVETVSHISETAAFAASADDYLSGLGRKLLAGCETKDGQISFSEKFFQEEPIIKRYAVREALARLAGSEKDLTQTHVCRVLDLEKKQVHRQVSLPGRLRAVRTYEGIRIEKARKGDTEALLTNRQEAGWILPEEGTLRSPLGNISCRIFFYHLEKIPEKQYTKWLDYDKIQQTLSVRTRNPGDYLVINGDGNRKKLNRFLIDEKIPVQERDGIVVVASGNEIVWVIGRRISENYKVSTDTVRVLELVYEG